MEDDPRQLVATLAAVKLDQDAAAVTLVIDKAQHIERLGEATQLLERPGQLGRTVVGLQRARNAGCADDAQLQRSRQAQQVVPVLGDQLDVDPVRSKFVKRAVIGLAIDAPEPGAADVGKAPG